MEKTIKSSRIPLLSHLSPIRFTPKQANELREYEFTQKIADGHQVPIYTYTDKDHYKNCG